MVNPLDLLKPKNSDDDMEDYVLRLHHALMKQYGWIPLKEFRKLPIPTVIELISMINADIEAEQKAFEQARKR